jgi:hypothetical protein
LLVGKNKNKIKLGDGELGRTLREYQCPNMSRLTSHMTLLMNKHSFPKMKY